MNEAKQPAQAPQGADAQKTAVIFAGMVAQQTNMALMYMGQVPHPQTGEPVRDLNVAKMFIDQLEMLDVKTKGNLDKQEERMLQQSLTALRMAFVEAVNQGEPTAKEAPKQPSPAPGAAGAAQPAPPAEASAAPAPPSEEAESRKKFSKKY